VSAPPASSVTVTAGQRAQGEVAYDRTRKVTLDPGASANTPVRDQGPGRACPDRTRASPCTGAADSHRGELPASVTQDVAGLNSTPALISLFMFFTCLQALNVSYKRSTRNRDKKGKVSSMRSVGFRVSGRKLAVPLAALRSAVVGCAAASGGSG
jgi:hypothetical protein